jgi:hypothetical protein
MDGDGTTPEKGFESSKDERFKAAAKAFRFRPRDAWRAGFAREESKCEQIWRAISPTAKLTEQNKHMDRGCFFRVHGEREKSCLSVVTIREALRPEP